MIIQRTLLITALLSITHLATAAKTKMPETLKASSVNIPIACQKQLNLAAQEIIGKKDHRILEHPLSKALNYHFFVLLSYHDQESHVSFTATPDKNGSCQVSYSEMFEIKTPCTDARESLFKRWAVIGKFSSTTLVLRYDYPRDKATLPADEKQRAFAFLTQTSRGKRCLVSKKQYQMPLLSETKND